MTTVQILMLCFSVLSCAGGIRIKECSSTGWLEVREDNSPSTPISCEDFSSTSTITWTLSASGVQQGRYRCGPDSQQCPSTDPNINISWTGQGSQGSSVLTIDGDHRSKVGNGSVQCQVFQNGPIATCGINVITPATIITCGMTNNESEGTVSGSCQFQKAYSSNGTYTCTWYRHLKGQSSRHYLTTVPPSTISRTTTAGPEYYSGVCSLPPSPSPETDRTYVYTLDFSPGPLRHPAGEIIIRSPSSPVVTRPTEGSTTTLPVVTRPTEGSTTTLPVVTRPTEVSSSSSSDEPVSASVCAGGEGDRISPAFAAVIGCLVVALFVIIVLTIIIIFLIRRNPRQDSKAFSAQSPHTDAAPPEPSVTYTSLMEDDISSGRYPDPADRNYTALTFASVPSSPPSLPIADHTGTADTYDLVTPGSVPSPAPLPPSPCTPPASGGPDEVYENAHLTADTTLPSAAGNVPSATAGCEVYENSSPAVMKDGRGEQSGVQTSDETKTAVSEVQGRQADWQKQQQPGSEYENVTPSK